MVRYEDIVKDIHAARTREKFEQACPSDKAWERLTAAQRISISQLMETASKGFEADELTQRKSVPLAISKEFVKAYGGEYAHRWPEDHEREQGMLRDLNDALAGLKSLRDVFLRIAMWKTPRQKSRYESNQEDRINEAMSLAAQATDARLKLAVLMGLDGVGVPVASTLLYFLEPNRFPIFDVRARTTLRAARLWKRRPADASVAAWEEYVATMRKLADELNVTLRDLDKALFTYDKCHHSEADDG